MKASRNDSRLLAACITALVALLLVGLLIVARLRVKATTWPPERQVTEMVEADEEFVDLFDPTPVPSDPAPAPAAATVDEPAQAPTATADEPAQAPAQEVKIQDSKPNIPRPTAEEIERTEQRERARQGVSAAFGASASGDGGRPEAEAPTANGTGSGTVGGGWIMPAYAKVDSRLTGSIIIQAVIDRTGRVVSVGQIGGKAPASADRRLVERCIAEVRRHAFTRSDDNAPDRATARITYYFR